MKTTIIKIAIMMVFVALIMVVAVYSPPSDENNAKILIKAKVNKFASVVKISTQFNGIAHYAAIDSAYTMYMFSVSPTGSVSQTGKK
jgi:hypothetical protein